MRHLLTATLLGLVLFAGAARADDSPALREARVRYKEGIALYKRGKNDEAYTKFVQAYAVLRNQEILYNLAQTEYLTGKYLDANVHFRLYVKNDSDRTGDGRKLRDVADKELADIASKLGHIYVEAPAGARIAIDGQVLDDAAPLASPVDVTPGSHTVEASVGEKKRSVTVTAIPGAPTAARLVLDDAPVATPPAAPPPAPPAQSTAPAASAPPETSQPPPPAGNGVRTAVRWSLTGAAIVGVGVGFAFHADASSKSDSFNAFLASHPNGCANPSSDTCAQVHSLQDERDRSATLSTIFFIAGGVLGAGAIASWLFWPDAKHSTTTTWITPSVGVRGAGVTVGGHF